MVRKKRKGGMANMNIGDVLGTVLSAGTGGVFGLLGSVVGAWAKYKQEKQRQAWEVKKWEHETRLLELQMQAKAQETEQELAIVSQAGSWEGLSRSIESETAIIFAPTSYKNRAATDPAFPNPWIAHFTPLGDILRCFKVSNKTNDAPRPVAILRPKEPPIFNGFPVTIPGTL